MARISWGRLILGGLIAAIIMFFTDGFIHEKIVMADWKAVYAGHLATSIVATIVGALLYKDAAEPAAA